MSDLINHPPHVRPAKYRGHLFHGYLVRSDGVAINANTGRILRGGRNSKGYRVMFLREDGESYPIYAHRLIYEAFNGPIPQGLEVCHNDGNPGNNALGNLRADTHSANLADRMRHGTDNGGERSGHAKLTNLQAEEVRNSTESTRIISARYGISRASVGRIKRNESYRRTSA